MQDGMIACLQVVQMKETALKICYIPMKSSATHIVAKAVQHHDD
jgi:hypothetical protein